MTTVWHGVVNPPRTEQVRKWDYSGKEIVLNQGDEMGRFQLGSTVVMLWPRGTLEFNPAWKPAGSVNMGEEMGQDYPA